MLKEVNIGSKQGAGDGETMYSGMQKINDNFKYLQSIIGIDLKFSEIEWNNISDTYLCAKNIKDNFGKLKRI